MCLWLWYNSLMDAQTYFLQNLDAFIKELGAIVSFSSISTDPAFKQNVIDAAKWVQNKLLSLGFETKVIETSSNPIILGRHIANPNAKTVLLYGHYDVQPVAPVEDWSTPPFTLTQKDGKLFARGIMDNKGQFMMHVSALEALLKTQKELPVNISFIIEGDEETGSADLDSVIKDNTDFLKADVALISDGEMIGNDTPVIEASFRGVLNCEISLTGPKEDLHSGVFGGAIANPAYELSSLIAKLYDKDYRITIPQFYDDVEDITAEEKETLQNRTTRDEEFLELSGSKKLVGEKGYSKYEHTGLRPTLQVTGLQSGYTGVGFKNIVPSKAYAKFNFRLVANQNPQKIYDNFVKFINDNISDGVRYEISNPDMVPAVKINIDNDYMKKARAILAETYGKEPIINFVGGTLPVVIAIESYLHVPVLSVPLSQEDCGMHAPNERLLVDAFKRGVLFSLNFLTKLS